MELTLDSSLCCNQRWGGNALPPESSDTPINFREKDGWRKREKKKGWRQVWHVCTVPGSPKLPSLISGCGSRWDTEALSAEKPQICLPWTMTHTDSRTSWDNLVFSFCSLEGMKELKVTPGHWDLLGLGQEPWGDHLPFPSTLFTPPLHHWPIKALTCLLALLSQLHSLRA